MMCSRVQQRPNIFNTAVSSDPGVWRCGHPTELDAKTYDVKFDVKIYGTELGIKIYGVELSVMSPSRLHRVQELSVSNDSAELRV